MTKVGRRTVSGTWRGAAVVLAVLAVACALAEFLAPYPYDEQRNEHAFAPPTGICFHDGAGWSARPFVHPFRMETDPSTYARRIVEDESRRVYLRFFPRGTPYRLFGIFPADVHLFGLADAGSGTRVYLFGADALGRDLLARVLTGGRVSLIVGPYVLLLLIPLAALLGGISGYCGGWVDFLLQRFGEIAVALPGLPVLLVMGSLLGARHAPPAASLLAILGALAVVGWGGMARVVRGQVLSIRERDFVLAARALGAGHVRILCRHVLPHVTSYLSGLRDAPHPRDDADGGVAQLPGARSSRADDELGSVARRSAEPCGGRAFSVAAHPRRVSRRFGSRFCVPRGSVPRGRSEPRLGAAGDNSLPGPRNLRLRASGRGSACLCPASPVYWLLLSTRWHRC